MFWGFDIRCGKCVSIPIDRLARFFLSFGAYILTLKILRLNETYLRIFSHCI